jgi:hypothetical protein
MNRVETLHQQVCSQAAEIMQARGGAAAAGWT